MVAENDVTKIRIRGDRLRRLRKERGLTQKTLQPILGVDQSAISKWERSEEIGIDNLAALARFFGVTTDYLLGLSDCRISDRGEAIKRGTFLPVKLLAHIGRRAACAPENRYLVLGLDALEPPAQVNDLIVAQSLVSTDGRRSYN